MNFSNEEYADMVFMYGRANGNAREASRFYAEAFPQRHQPNHQTFQKVYQRLRES